MDDGSNSPAAMYMEAEDYDPDKCYFGTVDGNAVENHLNVYVYIMLQIHVKVYISTSTYKIYDLKYCNTSTSRVLTVFTYMYH